MRDFAALLKALLVEELAYEPDEAERLVSKHHRIVMRSLLSPGVDPWTKLRPCAMAIELAELREAESGPGQAGLSGQRGV